jgi:hypothetical protein
VSAVDLHAEAHRLQRERGYGARRIAERLGITRHAATQLLARPLPQPVAEQAAAGGRPVAAQQASHPAEVAATGGRLVIDLGRFPGLADDLALLTGSGATAEQVVDFAVDRLATAYRHALEAGRLRPGQTFRVTRMWLAPGAPAQRSA